MLLELQATWDSQSDNQMVGSTSKSSSDTEVVRKHRMALSTSREKVLTAAPNANRADSSKRTRGTTLEAEKGKNGKRKQKHILPSYLDNIFRKEIGMFRVEQSLRESRE